MKITRKFVIQKVVGTNISNAPFQIVLNKNAFSLEKESCLTLDLDTCSCYGIPMSLDLVGQTLTCIFESRELPIKDQGYTDRSSLENDDLEICSLTKNESSFMNFGFIPRKVSCTLELSSFDDGDGLHPVPLPCPFYKIILELSEEEYELCKALPPASVFKVSFCL